MFTAFTQSHVCTMREECKSCTCWFVCARRVDGERRSGTQSNAQRLPSSATDAHVWPTRVHKALLAQALVRARSVHTASVLAWTNTDIWFCTLVNVWNKEKQVFISDNEP